MFRQKKYKKSTSAKDNAEVIFYEKRQKGKEKRKRFRQYKGNNRPVIIHPDMVKLDDNGSYTGMTKETYYNGVPEEPVQDADDL